MWFIEHHYKLAKKKGGIFSLKQEQCNPNHPYASTGLISQNHFSFLKYLSDFGHESYQLWLDDEITPPSELLVEEIFHLRCFTLAFYEFSC